MPREIVAVSNFSNLISLDLCCYELQGLTAKQKKKKRYFKPDSTWNFGYEKDKDFEKSQQVERNSTEAGTV